MDGVRYTWVGWSFEPAEWRLLTAAGDPVSLPNRTLALLALLLDRAPSLVTKDEILAEVWHDSVVEEGNIAFHVAALRKALDGGEASCIETVRGRGYRFQAPVSRRIPVTSQPHAPPDVTEGPTRPPSARRGRPPVWSVIALAGLTAGVGWFAQHTQAPPVRAMTVLSRTNGLAEVTAARIANETTVRTRVGTPGPDHEAPVEAGKRLEAEAVLTVSLDQTHEPWRVIVEVTRTRDRRSLWSWMFPIEPGTPGVANASIAARVASGLGRHFGVTRAVDRRSTDPAGFELSLQARELWRQRTPHAVQQAIRLYERAVAIDPGLARAYSGLADCYNLTMSGLTVEERYPRALEYASKAIALDPNDAAGHTSLAFLRYKFEWRWQDADAEFRRAIALDPAYALAHHWYGEFLGLMGRFDEAITQLRLAMALEPESLAIRSDLIPPLLYSGRVAEARAVVDAAAATDPNWHFIPYRMEEVFRAEGREQEAVESRWRWMLLSGVPLETVDRLRAAYEAGGIASLTRAEIAGYLKSEATTPGGWLNATFLSRLYGRLGEREEALRWLNIALDRREDAAIGLLTFPDYDSLRGDPAFVQVLARAGLK